MSKKIENELSNKSEKAKIDSADNAITQLIARNKKFK